VALRARVPDAVQHERSDVVHRWSETPLALENRGPGSAAHRKRAALRPGQRHD